MCTASPHVHNWRVDRVVPWRGKSHINTLELGTIGILERDLAITHPRSRFTALVDSSVAKASSAKGRSTSLALQPGLRRAAAHQIGFELTPPLALHPRGSTLPMIRPARLLASRFTSICLYLSCILSAGSAFDASSRRGPGFFLVVLVARVGSSESFLSTLSRRFAPLLDTGPFCPLDFDSTLGFPGEGPLLGLIPLVGLLGLWFCPFLCGLPHHLVAYPGPSSSLSALAPVPFPIGLFSFGFLACYGSPGLSLDYP